MKSKVELTGYLVVLGGYTADNRGADFVNTAIIDRGCYSP